MTRNKSRWHPIISKTLKYFIYSFLFLLGLVILVLVSFRTYSLLHETENFMDAAPSSGRFIQTGDVKIFVQEEGPVNGHIVLFIHGTGAWSEIWRGTMKKLSENGYHTIAIDVPPFGYSEKPKGSIYSVEEQAKRISSVIESLNISQVTLVGHSFGSRATVETTLLNNGKIKSLILVDPALSINSTESKEGIFTKAFFSIKPLRNAFVATTITNPLLTKKLLILLISNTSAATKERIKMLQSPMVVEGVTNDVGNWLEDFLYAKDNSLSSKISSYSTIKIPVLLIWGENDTIVPVSKGEYLSTLIPKSQLVVLKNSGHIPHIEDETNFNNALLEFLNKYR